MQRCFTRLGWFGLLVSSVAMTACGDARVSLSTTESSAQALIGRPTFSVCNNPPFVDEAPQGFIHGSNAWWSARGARHTAQDVIALPGTDVGLGGRFAYGLLRAPLRDEEVNVLINTCAGWNNVGLANSGAVGDVGIPYHTSHLGRFDVVASVAGDGTTARARLHTLPPGTHLVVFDIDGTLTVSNAEFLHQLQDNSYVPKAFAGAVAATQAWANKGYVVMYLTGRPRAALEMTRRWLRDLDFAAGPLHVTNDVNEILPTRSGVGEFKRSYLADLTDMGYSLDYAYGNESTDTYAYLNNGMPSDRVFTLGDKAGMDNTEPLPEGYADHLDFIASAPAPDQPFLF